MKKRVVITGMGIISCLGNSISSVLHSLQNNISGIKFQQKYADAQMRSHVAGSIDIKLSELIERTHLRFMNDAAAFSYLSMQQAIDDAGLTVDVISHEDTGIISGSGGASPYNQGLSIDTARSKGIRKVGPYMVPKTMGSCITACLATSFKIKGVNYSLSSACATSSHCIGHAAALIQAGKQKVIFAGGGDEESLEMSLLFDAMGALSLKYNDSPATASRPYDANRDGFIISGGAGMLVVEELEHALNRGAKIYAEITGYSANSDGYSMVAPSGEGAVRCMNNSLRGVNTPVDYVNTHATSTLVGDIVELGAIKQVFNDKMPFISSTKSLSGHSLGATGVHESIYSILMMEHNFITASSNITTLDEKAKDSNIVLNNIQDIKLNCVMSTNFGFGGTNASLVYQKYTA